MAKFNEQYVFTGMQRDIDVSKHPASFLYDARNIRLTQRDGKDTLYAITNEKGTTPLEVDVQGSYLGHAQINNFLVIFSTDGSTDYISTIDLNSYITTILYEGNLNFDINYPITAVGSYENENIQKVYWTDGKNQPRMINIAGTIRPGIDTQFDFLPELALNETVTIKKQVGSVGSFPAGVLQYMFTYYNKHGHESNIFYTSPLLYISPADRGAAPDEKVSNSFQINISNVDLNFDYLRIYSIHRSSINGTPSAKLVEDIAITPEATDAESFESMNIVRFPKLFQAQLSSDSAYISGPVLIQKGYLTSTRISLEGSEEEFWYVFRYSDCPELRLRYFSVDATSQEEKVNYITWGDYQVDNSQEDRQGWVIYVTAIPVTIEGTKGATILCFNESKSPIERRPLKHVQKGAAVTSYSYIDTGTRGESIDPMELLYKQKDKVVGGTIEQKDGTLFLGNLSYSPTILEQKDVIANAASLVSSNRRITFLNASNDSIYNYQNQLTSFEDSGNSSKSVPCGGFKTGEYYRLGVQFQDKYGKWSDPIYIDDISEDVRPVQNDNQNNTHTVDVPTFTGFISSSIVSSLKSLGYKKARAVVVYPDIQDREILCQGVTSPTVYRENDFNKNKVAGQSSWFFRPRHLNKTKLFDSTNINICAPVYEGEIRTSAELENLGSIETFDTTSSEVNKNSPRLWEIQGYYQSANRFNVFSSSFTDTNRFGFDTMHTPDVEFDSNVINQKFNSTQYKLVGYTKITTTLADIDIQTKSPTISNMGSGFDHQSFTASSAKGIISGLFYDDFVADELGRSDPTFIREYTEEQSPVKWLVYPWHRDGSLNNDINRPANAGVRSAELKIKKLSNLRYGKTVWGNTIKNWKQGPFDFFSPHVPELFYSDEPSIVKVGNYIYKGNIDTVLIPDISDGMYFCYNDSPVNTSTSAISIPPRLLNEPNVVTPIDSTSWWKTFAVTDEVNATPTEPGTVEVYTDSNYGAVRILLNGVAQEGNSYSDVIGTILNLQVKPNDNYTVKCWRRGSTVSGREIAGTEGYEMLTVSIGAGTTKYYAQLTMTSSSSVPSNMATVELAVNPTNAGSITGLSNGQYPIGSQHNLEAVANTSAGYVFNQWQNWSGATLSTSPTLSIVVASGGNYYKALFSSTYTVTALGDYNIANAYVGLESNPTTSSVVVAGPATVNLSATANDDNAVIGWLEVSNNIPSIVSYREDPTQDVNSASTFKAITTRVFQGDSIPVTFRVYVVYNEVLYDEITEDVATIAENTQEDGEILHYPEDTYTYNNRIDSIFLPHIGNSDFTFYAWGIGSVVDRCSSYAYWDNAEPNAQLVPSSSLDPGEEQSLCLILQTTKTYTLTLSKSGGDSTCTMSSNPATSSILAGRKVTITATSGSSYRFSGWYMGSTQVSEESSYEFNILDNVEYTAHFEADPTAPYTLLINGSNGTINIQKSDSSAYNPETLTVSVRKYDGSTESILTTLDSIASEGLIIEYDNSSTNNSWTDRVTKQWDDIIDSKGTTTVNLIKDNVVKSSITVNLQVKVTFSIIAGNTTLSSGSINDGISNRSNGTYYYYQIADTTGQTHTPTHSFTAKAGSQSFVFVKWQVNGVDYSTPTNSISLALIDVTTLTAVFAQATTYNIIVQSSPTAGGTVSGGGTYVEGSQVTISATPSSGYTFAEWQLNGTTVSTASTYTFTAGSSTAGTYTAVFTQGGGTTYNVSAVVLPEDTGTVRGTGSVASGNTVTLEANPISPYSFLMWTSQDSYISLGTNATYVTPAITSNITYRAFFTQYRITFKASSNAYTNIPFNAYIYNGSEMLYNASYTGLSTSQPYSFLRPAIDGYTLRIVMNDSTTFYSWTDTTTGGSSYSTDNGVVIITISRDMNLVLGQ